MKAQPTIGSNRTGMALAPEMAEQMIAASTEFPPSSEGDDTGIGAVRIQYAKQADPIGTVPPPAGVKHLAKAAAKALMGGQPTLLMDKLGARLAFERTGARLWHAMVVKFDAAGSFKGGPSREDIEHIRDEELAHFHLVRGVIQRMGGDPTAVTPSANIEAVASKGVPAVVVDPRTTMMQALEAALVAELTDNECWTALIELARIAGQDDDAASFEQALEHEREHLEHVREWLAAGQGRSTESARILTDAERQAVRSMAVPSLTDLRSARLEASGNKDGNAKKGRARRTTKKATSRRRTSARASN